MTNVEAVTNEIFVPSKQVDHSGGVAVISAGSMARADRVLSHYYSHPDVFISEEAFILCSGGYSGLANDETAPKSERELEGNVLADYFLHNGVSSRLLRVENRSVSALSNVAESVAQGYIDPSKYNQDRRLGVAAPRLYSRRLTVALGKVGVPKNAIEHLYTDDLESLLMESIGLAATYAYLRSANSPEDLLAAEQKLLKRLNRKSAPEDN